MNPSSQIIVSLSSFGAAEVRRHGQGWFAALCRKAGADGVEVRGELLTHPDRELAELSSLVRDTGLAVVYSSPEMLWDGDGSFNRPALETGLARASILGAPILKMSIGGFNGASRETLPALKSRLAQSGIELFIENDQSVSAGSVPALQRFFDATHHVGLKLGMTFDLGNWHWVGECPIQAARTFAPLVRYVHCKGVQRQPHRWVAVPLGDSAAPWRSALRILPSDTPRAIEYPLIGDDLTLITRMAVQDLRNAGVQG